MSAQILDGKVLAAKLKEQLVQDIAELKRATGITPRIVSIVAGHDPGSLSYVASQQKTAQSLGIHYTLELLKPSDTQARWLDLIQRVNRDKDVHGVIVNKPLPASIDFKIIINAIHPDKDIEGMNLTNLGRLFLGQAKMIPCTPASAMAHLRSTGIDLKGKEAVVIGRSEIVGKPMAMLLLKEDMTVTVCHSKTRDLPGVVGRADVVVAAIGKPLFVKAGWIKHGAIVIDVGINQVDGNMVGDVDFNPVKDKASFITPVPGGVGPLTSVMLMKNLLEALK